MDVPGKRHDRNSDKGSAEDFTLYCEPCDTENKRLQANGYCQTCGHYLCESCYKIHTKPLPMRNHKLLDLSSVPTQMEVGATKTSVRGNTCSIACPDHDDKIIEFYCSKHNKPACGVCVVLNHKVCRVRYIPDISVDYKLSEEYRKLIKAFSRMEENVEQCLTSAVTNTQGARETNQKAIDDICELRKEINAYLDQKEKELVEEAHRLRKKVECQLEEVQEKCKSLQDELAQMKSEVTDLEEQSNDLLVKTKYALARIPDLQKRIDQCCSSNKALVFSFNGDKTVEDILQNKAPLGCLDQREVKQDLSSPIELKINFASVGISKISDVNAKDVKESAPCFIAGMALLSPGTLIVCDRNDRNTSVKMIDIPSNTVKSRLQLSSAPYDVTLLPFEQAAVTLPCEQLIQIISCSSLTPVSNVMVSGECRGIDTFENQLVVSYVNPGKVEIMTISGDILKTITSDKYGKVLFSWPEYVAVGKDKRRHRIYVSDFGNKTLTKLTADGTVLFTYNDKDLRGPEGLTVTQDGHVIICSWRENTVQLVSPSGNKVRTLLRKADQVVSPYAVCYSAMENKLYVGCDCSDTIKVYLLK